VIPMARLHLAGTSWLKERARGRAEEVGENLEQRQKARLLPSTHIHDLTGSGRRGCGQGECLDDVIDVGEVTRLLPVSVNDLVGCRTRGRR
jgi:hypothetical protein